MPIFEIASIDPDDKDGQASTLEGLYRVHAPDEEHAREWLDAEFRLTVERTGPYEDTVLPPWRYAERFACRQVADPPPEEYREGQIEVYRTSSGGGAIGTAPLGTEPLGGGGGGAGSWTVINEGKPLEDQAALPEEHPEERTVESGGVGSPSVTQQANEGGGGMDAVLVKPGVGVAAGSSSAAAEGTATLEITQQTVTYVIQNRAAIGGQTSLLLKLLDGLDGLDDDQERRRNYSLRDALGLTSEINESELITLLRELRDELRQFREALESASVEPTTLEQLRDIGLGNLKALSTNKVFVTMQGAALGGMLWTLLVNVGAIDVTLAKEILGLILD